MAATISTSLANSVITVTGSGYTGSVAGVVVAYAATDGKRKYREMRTVPVVAGAISIDVPVPFGSGAIVVATNDAASIPTTLATSGSVAV